MIPIAGKKYYIDYRDGPEYTHYHGPATCNTGKLLDIEGPCYAFTLPTEDGEDDNVAFPVEAIITEVHE
jgi:hypothetical protein